MLEVKNIVNREINGIPKMEYWVQMQVQMEVCELNECDFLETRFIEYANLAEYEADTITPYKGRMMLFMTANGKPLYEYEPIISVSNDICNDVSDTWHESMMEKNQSLTWIKNIYWKLDQLSCVLVLRNKLWFKVAVPQLKELWTIIEKEKESGYSHRQPKKTQRSKIVGAANIGAANSSEDLIMKSQCYINIL